MRLKGEHLDMPRRSDPCDSVSGRLPGKRALGLSSCTRAGRGAVWGALAWSAYASLETLVAVVLPRFLPEGYIQPMWNWKFNLLVFGCYVLLGAVIGAGLGLLEELLRRRRFRFQPPPSFLPSCAALSVSLALAGHLSRSSAREAVGGGVLVVCGLLAATQALAAVWSRWAQRTAFVTNAWTASGIVLVCLWVVGTFFWQSDGWVRHSVVASILLTGGAVSWALWRLWLSRRASSGTLLPRAILAAAFGLAVLGGATLPPSAASLHTLSSESGRTGPRRPNVVLIVLDTVRADHLSVYGYERDTAPCLREFSSQAAVYRRAFATSDFSLPSHASLFTGLYGLAHGAHPVMPDKGMPGGYGTPLAESHITLAEILSEAGFQTAAISANYAYLSSAFGLDQGFRYHEVCAPLLALQKPFWLRQPMRTVLAAIMAPADLSRDACRAEEINRRAFAVLDRAARSEQPFFLFLNYLDAHWPYVPPPPFDTAFPGKSDYSVRHFNEATAPVLTFQRELTPGERAHLISQYDGALRYLDFELCRLFDRMRKLGLYDDTMIIITSDHGEAFGERNEIWHSISLYDNQVRVPLLIKYPQQRQRRDIWEPVSLVDVFPTVLRELQLAAPRRVQGIALQERAPGPRSLLAESYPHAVFATLHPRFRRVERAVIRWPYKLIAATDGGRELYHLESDPGETRNLYEAEPAVVAELSRELQKWLATAGQTERWSPDPETLRRLKSLGYTQ